MVSAPQSRNDYQNKIYNAKKKAGKAQSCAKYDRARVSLPQPYEQTS
jgi:hypothetical protein